MRRSTSRFSRQIPVALTFDDVLLRPTHSTCVSRKQISLRTRLSKNIVINNPLVSSNMDTVTEAPMAIAMAQSGGIGFLHRYLSTEEQVDQVRRVKRAEAFVIEEPYTIGPDMSVRELRERIAELGVRSMLVVDGARKLLGIVTHRDLRFPDREAHTVAELMTPRARLHVAEVGRGERPTPEEARALLQRHRLEKLPLVTAGNEVEGLISSRDLYHYLNNPHASHDGRHRLLVGAAVGVKEGDRERAERLVEAGADVVVVDVAHGHSALCLEQVRLLRRVLPGGVDVVAGNVATGAGALALAEAGADGVKVGVGPGSICTTRVVTGCGVPQLSALLEVSAALREARLDVPVIADGGIRTSGDICKALAAGAQTVMLGSALAGTDESPGQVITKNGKKQKVVRGMAGFGANLSNRLRQAKNDDIFNVVPEGVEGTVPYRGGVRAIVHQLCGGLASGISYCGGRNIEELQANAEFVRITGAGLRESGSHDVSLL